MIEIWKLCLFATLMFNLFISLFLTWECPRHLSSKHYIVIRNFEIQFNHEEALAGSKYYCDFMSQMMSYVVNYIWKHLGKSYDILKRIFYEEFQDFLENRQFCWLEHKIYRFFIWILFYAYSWSLTIYVIFHVQVYVDNLKGNSRN